MIYLCHHCSHTGFAVQCTNCLSNDSNNHIPLNPKFYPEFQYQSKGLITDALFKKKDESKLKAALERILMKYNKMKHPYFINFFYINNYLSPEAPKEITNTHSDYNSSYSELDLFYKNLVIKGFTELEDHPHLLHKLLLTTGFEALYIGFRKEIDRHIKGSLEESLESWIDETGTAFRRDLPLLLYYLWTKQTNDFNLPFNQKAEEDLSIPLINLNDLHRIQGLCEGLYYKILINRLDSKLTRFDPDKFITIHHVDAMDGYTFEDFLVSLFTTIGYDVEGTKRTYDQGADLFVNKFGQKTVIQAKNYTGSVGNSAVQQALAAKTFYQCDHAMVVSNSYFTKSAIELAETACVSLIDRDKLKEYIKDYNQMLINDIGDTKEILSL